ncbi:hypothetical protein AAHA92_11338 [Salvia divinorum]|uniref:Uncharacterized protein n=1 Tax=Salvia divinorum TaxID=28513 RepID=A0ABD1HGS4_SALDI
MLFGRGLSPSISWDFAFRRNPTGQACLIGAIGELLLTTLTIYGRNGILNSSLGVRMPIGPISSVRRLEIIASIQKL